MQVTASLFRDEQGVIHAIVADMEGCHAAGATEEEALHHLVLAVRAAVRAGDTPTLEPIGERTLNVEL